MGEVLKLSYGKALKQEDRSGGSYPVVGSGGVVGHHDVSLTTGPTVVVGRKGSIGSVTWIDGPAWPIDTAYFVEPLNDAIDLRWTYWTMQRLGLAGMNKSAAIPGLNREDVYRLGIKLPTLGDQRRIAAILDHADALRAKRRQVLAHFDDLTQSIFYEMFGRRSDAVEQLCALVDSAERIGYGVVQPGDDVEGGVPLIRVADLVDGRVSRRDLKRISPAVEGRHRRSRIQGNEILVSTVGRIGAVSVVGPEDVGSNIARAVARVPISDAATRAYVAAYLQTETPQRYFKSEIRAVAQPTLNIRDLAAVNIPVPPLELRRKYALRISQTAAQCLQIDRAVAVHDELFASLQSRAFKGEL